MIVVTVSEPSGRFYSRVFDKCEITIGRGESADLTLCDGNVSQRHGIISYRDGKFIVADTDSTNGIYVNGRMVTGPIVVTGPNTIHIAAFTLVVSMLQG